MRLFEFIEGKLTEQAAPAFNLGGLNPQQFQQRYGMSSQQAANAFNNIRALNPAYNTPRFSSALNQFLLDNPKAMQAANENLGPRNAPRVNPGSLARGAAGRLLGAIGLILTPTAGNEGEDLKLAQMQQMQEFEDYLLRSDPIAYKQLMDTYAANMSDQEREGGFDPRQSDEYRAAEEAARILQRQIGAPVARIEPTAPQIEPEPPAQPETPEIPINLPPQIEPEAQPIEIPARPRPITRPDVESPPQIDPDVPRTRPVPRVRPDAPSRPAQPDQEPSDVPTPATDPEILPISRPATLPEPITPVIPQINLDPVPNPARNRPPGNTRPPQKKSVSGKRDRDRSEFAPMKFTPIQIADPLNLRRYQQFK